MWLKDGFIYTHKVLLKENTVQYEAALFVLVHITNHNSLFRLLTFNILDLRLIEILDFYLDLLNYYL